MNTRLRRLSMMVEESPITSDGFNFNRVSSDLWEILQHLDVTVGALRRDYKFYTQEAETSGISKSSCRSLGGACNSSITHLRSIIGKLADCERGFLRIGNRH